MIGKRSRLRHAHQTCRARTEIGFGFENHSNRAIHAVGNRIAIACVALCFGDGRRSVSCVPRLRSARTTGDHRRPRLLLVPAKTILRPLLLHRNQRPALLPGTRTRSLSASTGRCCRIWRTAPSAEWIADEARTVISTGLARRRGITELSRQRSA